MFFQTTSGAALPTLLLASAACLQTGTLVGDGPIRALVVEQRITGVPGMKPGEFSRQRLTFDASGQRLLLESIPADGSPGDGSSGSGDRAPRSTGVGLAGSPTSRVLLELGTRPPRVSEIDDQGKVYTVHAADLNALQEERDQMEIQIREKVRRLPARERKKILDEQAIRADGTRVVDVSRGETRKILGYSCEEVKVTENGRLVIHAWVTSEVTGGQSFYELYSSLGAFSREVLKLVREIRGLPLEATIKVITASVSYEIHATCQKVENNVEIPASAFAVPADYRKIEEKPGIVPCAVCRTPVESEEPGGGISIHPVTREELLTCSLACKVKLNDLLDRIAAERFKKRQGAKPTDRGEAK